MANEKRHDLIDRKTLAEELSSLSMMVTGLRAGKGVLKEFMEEYRKSVLRIVDEQATVDAVEVVHGRWERAEEFDFISGEYVTTGYHCNKCGCYYIKKSNYCPNCGSLMDGGGEQ